MKAVEIQTAKACGLRLSLTPNGKLSWEGTIEQLLMFNMNMMVYEMIKKVKNYEV